MIRERSHGPEGGARHLARSESVLLVQDDRTFEVIAKVRSVERFVPAGDGCALFAGFETEDKTLRLLDFDHRRFGEPIPLEENTYPEFIAGDRLVSLNIETMTLRLTPIDGGEGRSVVLPGKQTWNVAISGLFISCGRANRSELFVIDADTGTLREIPMIDTAPHAPVLVEHAADLTGYEQAQLELVRCILTSEPRPGDPWPWKLEELTFESIEITGEFPYTEIVGLFRIDYAPARRFGRRWRLYDDLGDMSSPADYVWFPLMETVAPGYAGHGVKESDDGIVWI
jgi:hypothetical protein